MVKSIVTSGPEYEVSVMILRVDTSSGQLKLTVIHYHERDNIIGKISAPIPIGSRGQFMFMF